MPDLYDETHLRDWYFEIEEGNWLSQIEAGNTVLGQLKVDDEVYADVGIAEKGNSSARVQGNKQPLNVTIDETVQGQDLLGYDVINLNNGFNNPTFTREVLTLRSMAEHMPAPKAGWAKVHVNDDYFSLYTLVEQIEGTFLNSWFESNDGWLFKGDAPGDAGGGGGGGRPPRPRPLDNQIMALRQGGPRFGSDLTWKGEDLAQYKSAYELKNDTEEDAPWVELREFIRVLAAPESEGGASTDDFPGRIRQELNVDGALWYLAATNLFTNYDSYYAGHNFYIYQAEEDGRFHMLPWDVNEAFGLFPGAGISPGDSTAVAQTDPFLMATGNDAASRPLIGKLLSVPSFRADYLAHYRTLLETVFEPTILASRIGEYQDLIRDAVEDDPNRLYSFDLFSRNIREDVTANGRAVPGILKVAEARYSWLQSQDGFADPGMTILERGLDPAEPVSSTLTSFAIELGGEDSPDAIELVYRVNQAAPVRTPMVAGPNGLWTGEFPALERGDDVSYYVRAAFADGRSAFFPASNQLDAWEFKVIGQSLPLELGGDLVINEIMADNETTLADTAEEFDDWVELYNRGDAPISLSGYYLSDRSDDPMAYALPDFVLAPGHFYLVWCDKDEEQGPDHANFALSKGGESLLLSTADATVDLVEFEAQTTDLSWARVIDGGDEWRQCWPASPAAASSGCESLPTGTPPQPTPGEVTPTATDSGLETATPDVADRRYIYLPVLRNES